MKKIFNILILVLALASFASCKKTTEGVTGITYYANIQILGDNPAIAVIGQPYEDAGCYTTMNGEDITAQTKVTSNVNTSAMGIYGVTYSAVNADGFAAAVTRDVYVANPGHFDNLYIADSRFGSQHYTGAPVMIKKLSDGNYLIDDIAGGLYWWGRYPGYEPTYDFHCECVLRLNADNTIDVLQTGDWYWGGEFESVGSTYYPEDGIVELVLSWDGDPFYVTLYDVTK